MGAPSTRLLPGFLELPLRDTLRGVRTARDLSGEFLRPAVRRMPSPIQRLLHETAEIAHMASRRIVGPPPDLAAMAVAAEVIGGTAAPRQAGETLAPLVVFGLEKALALDETTPLLSSEMLAAVAIGEALREPAASSPERVARILARLGRNHATGHLPGTGIGLDEADRRRIHRALFAVGLWILAERPADPADEERILEIAIGLARATDAGGLEPSAEVDAVAAALGQFAGLI
jgi:hypothetical protein